MKYIIKTEDATQLRTSILSCVNGGKDPQGKEIHTWAVTTTGNGEEVLIHVTDQWEDKGNLHLNPSKDNRVLEVRFMYWQKFPKESRSGDEAAYMLGRFTELLLVHFYDNKNVVEIN